MTGKDSCPLLQEARQFESHVEMRASLEMVDRGRERGERASRRFERPRVM